MCLRISKFHHLFNEGAKIAKHDIHVYKKLIPFKSISNRYMTPYLHAFYSAKKGRIDMESILKREQQSFNHHDIITKGIHAYRTKRCITNRDIFTSSFIYHAIIPKGSKYYVGSNKDIVSDHLIVFTEKKYFNAYKASK